MADLIKLRFFIRYSTHFGQSLWVMGNINEMGNDNPKKAIPLSYLNNEFWHGTILFNKQNQQSPLRYKYLVIKDDAEILYEWGNDRVIEIPGKKIRELQIVDTWNHAGLYENAFSTTAFQNVLLKKISPQKNHSETKSFTHLFKVKAPLLDKNEVVCLIGGCEAMGEWSEKDPVLMENIENWWTVKLNLKENGLPVPYKYGVYHTKKKKFLQFENDNNRVLYSDAGKRKITVVHDGFVHLANNTWKGAGVAIPVFSLRSKNSFGIGEFSDLNLLVDWAKASGLKMIQLLPVNDTNASGTWKDSYPYAAISAFALHPIYINLFKVAGKELAEQIKLFKKKQKQLNDLTELDYESVFKIKIAALKELFMVLREQCFASEAFKHFFSENKHWLEPYAAFCFFRDKTGTSYINEWGSNAVYEKSEIETYTKNDPAILIRIEFWYFVQFHLHLQLKEAAAYAHKNGIVLKGDIPIGVFRNSCDVWVAPHLFNMQWQAGAPPDDFSVYGQNWGFPIYNWKKMKADDGMNNLPSRQAGEEGFSWWKQRLAHMSNYFEAYRIDHILGFFRIWSIPLHAVQGLMGRFIPAIPVHISEFGENGILFDRNRFCKPYINDEILTDVFGEHSALVKEKYVTKNGFGGYDLLPGYETQKQIASYFDSLDSSEENNLIKKGLFEMIANVILFEESDSDNENFHFRILMDLTLSFKYLNPYVREKLKELYNDYFFRRQEKLWAGEAIKKLMSLKSSTDMLVCGEDLGMIPHCVKDVMQNLGILSLEIQRMPKDTQKEFFHPADAPYLSVVMPSTHDMSTIREWWLENKERTQRFYNKMLWQSGKAPPVCEIDTSKAIILQHLNAPAIWCVFQLQDLLGINEKLRRADPAEERINNPANPDHNWNYRMHLNLEELIKAKDFNTEIKNHINQSGRL